MIQNNKDVYEMIGGAEKLDSHWTRDEQIHYFGLCKPVGWDKMVRSPFMHDGVKMARENPGKALELELQHQAFRKGQEAGADALLQSLLNSGIIKIEELEGKADGKKELLAALKKNVTSYHVTKDSCKLSYHGKQNVMDKHGNRLIDTCCLNPASGTWVFIPDPS